MAFTGDCGLELDLRKVPAEALDRDDFVLFSESNSRFLIEVPEEAKDDFEDLMKGIAHADIGRTVEDRQFRVRGLRGKVVVEALLDDLIERWQRTFKSLGAKS